MPIVVYRITCKMTNKISSETPIIPVVMMCGKKKKELVGKSQWKGVERVVAVQNGENRRMPNSVPLYTILVLNLSLNGVPL